MSREKWALEEGMLKESYQKAVSLLLIVGDGIYWGEA